MAGQGRDNALDHVVVVHGAERKGVPYTVATDMDNPNPDTGEEHQHTNTQLYNFLAIQFPLLRPAAQEPGAATRPRVRQL